MLVGRTFCQLCASYLELQSCYVKYLASSISARSCACQIVLRLRSAFGAHTDTHRHTHAHTQRQTKTHKDTHRQRTKRNEPAHAHTHAHTHADTRCMRHTLKSHDAKKSNGGHNAHWTILSDKLLKSVVLVLGMAKHQTIAAMNLVSRTEDCVLRSASLSPFLWALAT